MRIWLRPLSKRSGRSQVDLSRAECDIDPVKAIGPRMARRQKPVGNHGRKPLSNGLTKFCTVSNCLLDFVTSTMINF